MTPNYRINLIHSTVYVYQMLNNELFVTRKPHNTNIEIDTHYSFRTQSQKCIWKKTSMCLIHIDNVIWPSLAPVVSSFCLFSPSHGPICCVIVSVLSFYCQSIILFSVFIRLRSSCVTTITLLRFLLVFQMVVFCRLYFY